MKEKKSNTEQVTDVQENLAAQKENLVTKLCQKFKKGLSSLKKSKVFKTVATLTLAVGLTAGAGAMTGCNLSGNPGNVDVPPIVDIAETENGYSQILNDIMNSEYYTTTTKNYSSGNYEPQTQLLASIPYNFLQSRGHDINAIKNDQLECKSVAYIKENEPYNLYLTTRVETDASTPYYTNYILKYTLNATEKYDFVVLHLGRHIQAGFFVQELDNQRTPTVISEASITVLCYEALLSSFKRKTSGIPDIIGTDKIQFDLREFSVDNQTFTVDIRTTPNLGNSNRNMEMTDYNGQVRILYCEPTAGDQVISNSNVLSGLSWFITSKEEATRFTNTYDKIYYYDSCISYPSVQFKLANNSAEKENQA